MPDESLLYCPSVDAPRVTELGEGIVVLQFTALPDGSIDDIRVVESAGDPRWTDAAIAAVSKWKYRLSERPVRKTQRFTFRLEE